MTHGEHASVTSPADAIKFRDHVLVDLVPRDVVNALLVKPQRFSQEGKLDGAGGSLAITPSADVDLLQVILRITKLPHG